MIFKNLLLASAACLAIGSASLIADECTSTCIECPTECKTTQECPCPKSQECCPEKQAIKAIEQTVKELDKTVTKLLTDRSQIGANHSQELAQALTGQYQELMDAYKASSDSFSQDEKKDLEKLLKDVYAKVLTFQDKQDMAADLKNQINDALDNSK